MQENLQALKTVVSLPVRGAWVEMLICPRKRLKTASLPVRGAWVEISQNVKPDQLKASLPVRGAWVEIGTKPFLI